jgi:hypothetical protein
LLKVILIYFDQIKSYWQSIYWWISKQVKPHILHIERICKIIKIQVDLIYLIVDESKRVIEFELKSILKLIELIEFLWFFYCERLNCLLAKSF